MKYFGYTAGNNLIGYQSMLRKVVGHASGDSSRMQIILIEPLQGAPGYLNVLYSSHRETPSNLRALNW